ncbi:alpha/beta hydrolase [Micromonospora sp. NPDC094482]|uniref:alpha/beta fold hydrolase n=1 Tax=unclassified Micromonospora TaxID=2617518 RepID=UPI00332E1DDB
MAREGEPGTGFAYRADSSRVAFEVSGAPDGYPVFLMHGTPGSRRGPKPRGIVLHRLGVRLITYDRPGYGDSDRSEGRTVADAAADVEVIADQLALTRFAVAGRSGGGPHALACAADARLRHRVSRVAALVGFAPSNAGELDWYSGMNADNVNGFGGNGGDTAGLVEEIRRRAERASEDPRRLLEDVMAEMTAADRRVINDAALRRLITDTYEEALRAGPYGWIDDVLALRRDWKFDPRMIDTAATQVRLWHGAEDTFAPVSHTRWLATRIPGAEIEVQPGAAHFDAMKELPRILRWLTVDDATASRDVLIGARPGQ